MAFVEALIKFFADLTPGAVGIWLGVGMFALYWIREFRETRKLSSEDRQARREGFESMVKSLQAENRDLRREMQADREAHAAYRQLCHQETDMLRKQIIDLHDEIAGYKRRLDTQAIKVAQLALPEGKEEQV
jgi:hypothetical protein